MGRPELGLVVTVADQPHARGGRLADRLEYLFRTVHPKDRGPYTPAEVAEGINAAAGERAARALCIGRDPEAFFPSNDSAARNARGKPLV
jgi:hypothetical protein